MQNNKENFEMLLLDIAKLVNKYMAETNEATIGAEIGHYADNRDYFIAYGWNGEKFVRVTTKD